MENKPIKVEGNSQERISKYCKNYNQTSFSDDEDEVEQDREYCQYTVSTAPLCSVSLNCYYCKFKPRLNIDDRESDLTDVCMNQAESSFDKDWEEFSLYDKPVPLIITDHTELLESESGLITKAIKDVIHIANGNNFGTAIELIRNQFIVISKEDLKE